MRQRQYPETIPVLASYWLKTVCAADHPRGWWKELNALLTQALRDKRLEVPSREPLVAIQNWIQKSGVLAGRSAAAPPSRVEPYRSSLRPEWLAPYVARLLNEWLLTEVASLLVNDTELSSQSEVGIPVLAIGKALERLLVRERLSPATLEMLLEPDLLSPRYVYPADAEMLRDVVSALLGRTWSPPLPVMPAAILAAAHPANSGALHLDEAVHNASFVPWEGSQEIHVPLPKAAEDLLRENARKDVRVRFPSILVTMDGRWWASERLERGEPCLLIHKPMGRLRINYASEHVKLRVPWPEIQVRWSGSVHFPGPVAIFGREWHGSSFEADGDRTWVELVFARALPIAEHQPAAETSFRRSRPAAVDIAWTALGDALTASLAEKSQEPLEQLRRPEFIPLGRAIVSLAESMRHMRLRKRETIETQLRAIAYLQAELELVYGRVPWKILPATLRASFMKRRLDPGLVDLLKQVFESPPESLDAVKPIPPSREGKRSNSPSQAA